MFAVDTLEPEEIRFLSEEHITNWSHIGGNPVPVVYLDYDDLEYQEDYETLMEWVAATEGGVAAVFDDELPPEQPLPSDEIP